MLSFLSKTLKPGCAISLLFLHQGAALEGIVPVQAKGFAEMQHDVFKAMFA